MLSYEEAKTLESDIAMLYSASEAKRAVLTEFEALTKLCLLKKESTVTPPENNTSCKKLHFTTESYNSV